MSARGDRDANDMQKDLEQMYREDQEIERSRAAEDAGYRQALGDASDPELKKHLSEKYQKVRDERRGVDAERAERKEQLVNDLDKKIREGQEIGEREHRRGGRGR